MRYSLSTVLGGFGNVALLLALSACTDYGPGYEVQESQRLISCIPNAYSCNGNDVVRCVNGVRREHVETCRGRSESGGCAFSTESVEVCVRGQPSCCTCTPRNPNACGSACREELERDPWAEDDGSDDYGGYDDRRRGAPDDPDYDEDYDYGPPWTGWPWDDPDLDYGWSDLDGLDDAPDLAGDSSADGALSDAEADEEPDALGPTDASAVDTEAGGDLASDPAPETSDLVGDPDAADDGERDE